MFLEQRHLKTTVADPGRRPPHAELLHPSPDPYVLHSLICTMLETKTLSARFVIFDPAADEVQS